MTKHSITALVLSLLFTTSAPAAQCGGDFRTFVGAMSREASAAGISRSVIDSALSGVSSDQSVLAFDRRQRGTFRMSFERYTSTRVTPGRIQRGRQLMQRHAALLSRIQRQFGVPAQVLVAIWGLGGLLLAIRYFRWTPRSG